MQAGGAGKCGEWPLERVKIVGPTYEELQAWLTYEELHGAQSDDEDQDNPSRPEARVVSAKVVAHDMPQVYSIYRPQGLQLTAVQ